jgi:hypothetical protein
MFRNSDETITGAADPGSLRRSLPTVAWVVTVIALKMLVSWPLALGLAAFATGLVWFWALKKSGRRFSLWLGMTVLVSALILGMALMLTRLGGV